MNNIVLMTSLFESLIAILKVATNSHISRAAKVSRSLNLPVAALANGNFYLKKLI